MSGHFYRQHLYPLQDSILRIMAASDEPFYLTGGTLLGRFILHHRYSDDLDFFLNGDPLFVTRVREVVRRIQLEYPDVEIIVNGDAFVRINIRSKDILLKVDFVNDVPFRVERPVRQEAGYLVDTWENVFANKITAMERDEPKDFVDILYLCFKYPLNWEDAINNAKKKDAWVNEVNVSQHLLNFKIERLQKINFIENIDVNTIEPRYFELLARESLHGFDNSLAGKM